MSPMTAMMTKLSSIKDTLYELYKFKLCWNKKRRKNIWKYYWPYNIFHSSNFRYELYNLNYKFQGVKNLKYYDTVEKFQYATDSRAIYFFNCFSSNIHTAKYLTFQEKCSATIFRSKSAVHIFIWTVTALFMVWIFMSKKQIIKWNYIIFTKIQKLIGHINGF